MDYTLILQVVLKVFNLLLNWKSQSDESKKSFLNFIQEMQKSGTMSVKLHDEVLRQMELLNKENK